MIGSPLFCHFDVTENPYSALKQRLKGTTPAGYKPETINFGMVGFVIEEQRIKLTSLPGGLFIYLTLLRQYLKDHLKSGP